MANKRKTQVFISYSRKNKSFVRKLNAAIDEAGIEAWVDWEGIPFSADWMATINSAIEASDAFVFVITPDSLKSKYCYKELEIALQLNKKIIPVVYHEPERRTKLHPKLSSTNWVFLRPKKDNFREVIPKLVETVLTDLEWVQQHTNLLQRAVQWKQKKENPGYLLGGSSLEEAEQWMAKSTEDEKRQVTPLQAEYIRACREYASRRQRRFTFTFGIMLVVSIIALMFAIRLWVQLMESEERAKKNAADAQASAEFANMRRSLAEESEKRALRNENEAKARCAAAQARTYSGRPGELDTSTLLALESLERFPSTEAEDVLRNNLSRMAIPAGQMRHTGRIWNISVSADGQYIVSASADDTACVWNMTGGKKYCVQHDGDVTDALITNDNSLLITASKDGTIRLWDFESGQLNTILDYESPVLDIDINARNKILVGGLENENVAVVNLDLRRTVYTFNFSNGPVNVVKFHPNGDWLSVGVKNGRVRLWKVSTGVLQPGPYHEAEVFDIAISPDGKIMVSISADSTARISRAESGRQTHVLQHPDWVRDVAFAPDSSWFATASDDKIVRVFDANTGVEKIRMYHGSFVQKVEVSPDGNWVASTGSDLSVRVWDAQSGALMLEPFLDDTGSALVFSPDGKRIIAGDRSGNITIWDISSLYARVGIIEFPQRANKAKFDPAGNWVLINTNDRNLWQIPVSEITTIHDGGLGTPILTFDEVSAQTKISPDSKWVAVSINSETGSPRALLYNLETQVLHTLPHDTNISGLAISPDSKRLATTNEGNSIVYIWDIETGQLANSIPFEETAFTSAYSPRDSILAIGLTNKIVLWDTASGKEAAALKQVGRIRSLNFNSDGNWLATTTSEGSINIWDMNETDLTAPRYRFLQDGRITSLDFNSRKQWLASGGDDGYVYLWDLSTGQEVMRIPHGDSVAGVSFSPDGQLLATVSRKIVQFWDVDLLLPIATEELADAACSRLVRNLNPSQWEFFFNDDEYDLLCPALP
ncbi:MAG: TIR domain-containing protein [Chloroflexi bacterium]|nr:TIR domain-containing protein [Chloroflexota bacterium]